MVVTEQLKMLWKDTCTIIVKQEITKANGATGFSDVALCTDEPCKVSFFNNNRLNEAASVGLNAAEVFQQAKLFIKPDLNIPEGSSITVVTHQNNKTLHFKCSSTPATFTNHQEILMEVDKKWA